MEQSDELRPFRFGLIHMPQQKRWFECQTTFFYACKKEVIPNQYQNSPIVQTGLNVRQYPPW